MRHDARRTVPLSHMHTDVCAHHTSILPNVWDCCLLQGVEDADAFPFSVPDRTGNPPWTVPWHALECMVSCAFLAFPSVLKHPGFPP